MDLPPFPLPACPAWCVDDLPTDSGGVIHYSPGHAVFAARADEGSADTPTLSIERLDSSSGCGRSIIRLQGVGEEMAPVQALALAMTLQAAAVTALVADGALC
jgi:hypothetical protein